MQRTLVFLIAFFIFIIFWEIASRSFEHLAFILPAPTKIVLRLIEMQDRFRFHTLVTLREMIGGFLVAFFIAFPLAWIMDTWHSARWVLQPLFLFIQCLPMFALAPLMVLWFGWTYIAVLIPTSLMIFFPLTINIYHGFRATPQAMLDFFRVNQATPFQIFYKLKLPCSLPHICSGVRIASTTAGAGAIAGEWAGGQNGLGILMIESRRGADLEMVFGALACLIGLSFSWYLLTTCIEKIFTKRPSLFQRISGMLLVAFCFSGCSQKQEDKVRLMLDWVPNPDHVPLYAGLGKGFFNEQGINLEILKMHDASDTIPYLSTGQADIGITYMLDFIRASEQNIGIEPIGMLMKEPLCSIIFLKGSGINEIKDLNGKIIGCCSDKKGVTFLDVILQNNGVIPAAKYKVGFDSVPMLAAKQLDAIYGVYWNIEGEHLNSLGMDNGYFKLSEFGVPNYYELIFVAQKKGQYFSEDFIHRFKIALQKSINYSLAYPEEAFELYLTANPDKSSKTKSWEKIAWEKTQHALATDQEIDEEVIQNYRLWLKEHQLL